MLPWYCTYHTSPYTVQTVDSAPFLCNGSSVLALCYRGGINSIFPFRLMNHKLDKHSASYVKSLREQLRTARNV